jgi:hypothetical protein
MRWRVEWILTFLCELGIGINFVEKRLISKFLAGTFKSSPESSNKISQRFPS